MNKIHSKYNIPFLKAEFPENITAPLLDVFSSGYVGAGKKVCEFEKYLYNFLGQENLLCTSSCSGALTLAFTLAGIKRGTKVLTTPMTCAATNIPLLHLGADIHWIDINPLNGNVTGESLSSAIKHHPDSKVLVIMDWGGTPCDYHEIEKIANEHKITIILDAAQSLGSKYYNNYVGSSADFICYSFGPTKILSSVDGGAIITSNKKHVSQIKKLRWHGIDRSLRDPIRFWEYEVEEAGYRFSSNDIFASVGIEMLKILPDRILHHKKIAQTYQEGLKNVSGIIIPQTPNTIEPNYWMFTIIVENRSTLIKKLHSIGIHAAIPHSRNDNLGCFKSFKNRLLELPGVDYFSSRYMCLPIGPWVDIDMANQICKEISHGW